MQGPESGNGCMVRCLFPLQQPQQVDIPVAGLFNFPAGINPVHVSIDKDLEHLAGCQLPFLFFAAVSPVQVSQEHAVQKLVQYADRIIRRDQVFDLQWKNLLIIFSEQCIIFVQDKCANHTFILQQEPDFSSIRLLFFIRKINFGGWLKGLMYPF